jgi:hypothetical protein
VLASTGEALFTGFHAAMVASTGAAALAGVVGLTMLGRAKMKQAEISPLFSR